MKNLNVLAIDLAKNNFQVCKLDTNNEVIYNKQVTRSKLIEILSKEKKALVAMASCGGTHYFARVAKEAGHEVKAMSAVKVKPFRQGQKTDANDALAIGIAARQPNVKSSRLLSVNEQCLQSMNAMRDLLVQQKVSVSNQLRACLLELGIPIAKSDTALVSKVPDILEDGELALPATFRCCIQVMFNQFRLIIRQIVRVEKQLKKAIKQDETCLRLQEIKGVGPIGSVLLKIYFSSIGHFKNGREASACAGVTPVQHSSGGKDKLGSISKVSTNKKLRSTLFQGALTVVCNLEKRECKTEKDVWLKGIIARRGKKVAAIALVNKTIRTAYALLKNNQCYQPKLLTA